MADALCGPSNPLQSLRKHTQLDRTLQQDRIVQSRQSAAAAADQQFRSHDPRTGSLDAALNAFEHAQPHPLDLHYQDNTLGGWQRQPLQHPAPVMGTAATAAGGWAADFQKLHISQQIPGPVPVSQFRTEAPLITSTNAGWHNDFLQQQQQQQQSGGGGMSLKGKEAATSGFSYDYGHQEMTFAHQPLNGLAMQRGFMDHQQYAGPISMQEQDQAHGSGQQQQQWENISSEAFEEAFQDALVSEAQAFEQILDDIDARVDALKVIADDIELRQQQQLNVKIGSDAIPYTEVNDRTADQDVRDADELARTAGQLVEMMKGESETNRKFRESEFLGLMRRLRDREIEVRDNEMVETSNTTTTSLGGGNVEQHQDPKLSQAMEEENNVAPATTTSTEQYDWGFPDMNDIYAPTNNDLDTASRSYSPFWESSYTTTADAAATASTATTDQLLQPQASRLAPYIVTKDELYHSGSDEFPDHQLLQEQALHPGGKWYPEQHQQEKKGSPEVVMSGAVTPDNGDGEAAIKASDFDNGEVEESGSLARRFSAASRPRSLSVSAAMRG